MLRLMFVFFLVNALATFPSWISSGLEISFIISLEAMCIVGFVGLLPKGLLARQVSYSISFLLALLVLVVLGDAICQLVLGRLLNLYLDVFLLRSVYELLITNVGVLSTVLILSSLVITTILLITLLGRLFNPNRVRKKGVLVTGFHLALLIMGGMGVYGVSLPVPADRIDAPLVRVAAQQTQHFIRMLNEKEKFIDEIEANRSDSETQNTDLDKIRGSDVFLGFIESYGVSAVFDEPYRSVVMPRLVDFGLRMETAGLKVVSGTLLAPSQGGQSWYGHASLLSGLWIDNQLRYDLLLAENPNTLVDDFREAGYETVALMPAITRAWPEGQRFGYDQIYSFENIDYAGPPLNWVTMPDQFTWSFLQNTIRTIHGVERPLFVELSLISSHAPWTPIIPVYDDWSAIGDGEIFSEWERTGPTPRELWSNHENVKEYYGLSLEYAINAMVGFAEHYLKGRDMLIVLGDHQAAPLITGEDASKAVPIHVISKDQSLLAPLLDYGFVPGSIPPDSLDGIQGMDTFRRMFLDVFSSSKESNRVSN
ncbi:MAG: hypothetical protein ACJ0RV_03215 [Longimicrobiales bacterium]